MKIKGYVQKVFWTSDKVDIPNYKYIGFTFQEEGKFTEITCFGSMPRCDKGDSFVLEGNFKSGKNGDEIFQVKAASIESNTELGAQALLKYMFGKAATENIVSLYWAKAIYAVNALKKDEKQFCDKCLTIKGIGNKKIEKALERYRSNQVVDILVMNYATYGMSHAKAFRIFSELGDDTVRLIEENPYCIIKVTGLTFKLADSIALSHFHLDPLDTRRVKAIVLEIMLQNEQKGHCFSRLNGNPYRAATEDGIATKASEWLGDNPKLIQYMLETLIDEGEVVKDVYNEKPVYYRASVYRRESMLAEHLSWINRKSPLKLDFERLLKNFEEEQNITLAKKQKEAIHMAITRQLSMITGLPGTGKTTIIKAILEIAREDDKYFSPILCAPTGRAASRMSEATGYKASTIHSLIYNNSMDTPGNLSGSIAIIDEFSMVDLELADKLFYLLNSDVRVVIIGDSDQLPSVGSGKVLEDLINSRALPHVSLNEIYRQSADSTLLQIAKDIHDGSEPSLESSRDFQFIRKDKEDELEKQVIDSYLQSIEDWGIESTVLLIPQNTGNLGCDRFNKKIQEIVNPKTSSLEFIREFQTFRVNDRVMQIKNEKKYQVFNGMVGTVVDIYFDDTDELVMMVDFDGLESIYDASRIEFLKLAYASTIHKSQGSEYPSVIMLITKQHQFMLRKKLFYTGLTRAKKNLVLIGQEEMVEKALKNKLEPYRNTRLAERLEE